MLISSLHKFKTWLVIARISTRAVAYCLSRVSSAAVLSVVVSCAGPGVEERGGLVFADVCEEVNKCSDFHQNTYLLVHHVSGRFYRRPDGRWQ